MAAVVLVRSREDRRRFDLAGYGSLRRPGWSIAVAELTTLDGAVLRTDRHGIFRSTITAADANDTVVGEYRGRGLGTSGDITWRGRPYSLRREGWFRSRYLLENDGQPVLRLVCRSWGSTPVSVVVDDPHTEAGLVLFAVSVARTVVADSEASA